MPWYRPILLPFSAIWWLVLRIRHLLYDVGLLTTKPGAVKTLVIGNLELGGTGKSQLTVFLIRLLKSERRIAVLSRGYGRSSSGYVQVEVDSKADQVGDEPLMFKRSFEDVPVAVCEDRLEGVERIRQHYPDVELVILDDAFQHRKLRPDFSILTTSFSQPYFKNALVPAGTLRDIKQRAETSDALVVTESFDPSTQRKFMEDSGLVERNVFFSASYQGPPVQVAGDNSECTKKVWLLSGIARSERFEKTAGIEFEVIGHSAMSDHHQFTKNELTTVSRKLDSFEPSEVSVLVTEKDAARTDHNLLNTAFHPFRVFYLPLDMKMPRQDELKTKILKHVFGEDQGNV